MKSSRLALFGLLFCLTASAVFAAGGQNQTQNPIFGDNCVEVAPPGIDETTCEEAPASPQSGVKVFFCDSTTVIVCADKRDGS